AAIPRRECAAPARAVRVDLNYASARRRRAGGPGRPPGSRPRLVTALKAALDEDETLQKLREVAIAKLEEGDPAFWRMLLDRVWPVRHELSGPGGGPLVSFADLARQAAEVRRDRQLED
ncbi:MAG: hypothetical protein V3U38_06760, partial [Gemmatimonadota bacterium]